MLINGRPLYEGDAGNGGGGAAGDGANAGQAAEGNANAGGGTTALTSGTGGGQSGTGQGQGTAIPDWASGLPDELKSSASLANYKDLPSFVKSALEAEKLIGKKGIIKPGENASPEELNKFYNELGRPEKPEDYGFKRPENWPKEFQFSEALVPKVQEMFHKRGIPADMAQGLWEDYHQLISEEAQSGFNLSKQQVEQGISNLKQEWGGEEKYNANVETAKMAVREFGGDELINFLEESGLGDHPAMIKAFANAGKSLREDGFVGGGDGGQMNQQRALSEIERLSNDKSFTDVLYSIKLEDKKMKEEYSRKWETLHKIAYPTFTN